MRALSVKDQLGIFDREKYKKTKESVDHMDWLANDPMWDDSDLAGMNSTEIREYLKSYDYEERGERILLAQKTTESREPSPEALSQPATMLQRNRAILPVKTYQLISNLSYNGEKVPPTDVAHESNPADISPEKD